jgi:hypothetical protein
MAEIDIQVQVCRKFGDHLLTTTPLIECGKQLAILVSRLAYICEQGLTAVATKATIGMGTSGMVTPSWVSVVGKRKLKREVNGELPRKNASRMTSMIREFRYGFERTTRTP